MNKNKEMKELIKEYQAGTNTEVIERIQSYVDEDLLQYKYKTEGDNAPDVEDGLVFVAYRIRALIMQHCFKDRNQRHIYEATEQDKEEYRALFYEKGSNDFYDENKHINSSDWGDNDEFMIRKASDTESSWISDFKDKSWLDVNVDEIRQYNFKSIYDNRKPIEKYYGSASNDLFYLCEKFKGRSQDSDEFREDFQRTKDKLLPFFEKGLEYALSKVDAEREEKEIVKYINIAMQTKVIELQMKEAGTKRIVKGKNSLYINPKFSDDADSQAWLIILGKSLNNVKDEWFNDGLTKSQREFLLKLFQIVKFEIESENVGAFFWNTDSTPRLNKRYVADKMEMKEDNFKKTLKRISYKVNENWDEIWSKYKNIG